jgi:hypothetical protein
MAPCAMTCRRALTARCLLRTRKQTIAAPVLDGEFVPQVLLPQRAMH